MVACCLSEKTLFTYRNTRDVFPTRPVQTIIKTQIKYTYWKVFQNDNEEYEMKILKIARLSSLHIKGKKGKTKELQ